MATEAMKHARFTHPTHGDYDNPEAVLNDDRLTDNEKRTVLDEWRSSLKHILRNDPDAPQAENTNQSLDDAAAKLAAGKI
ncbi:hypothetical protein [Jiella avicenniae]|uniref:Uncharacterized protein n=1 Tax=Jiella avicenniae TaxID=2907202 RepID=A0A9X1P1A3_9HYPH|nr:hypothetical protein [Jiella avicenniae]MCE7028520.1 hypothetical protein [Jiella avicenniae]